MMRQVASPGVLVGAVLLSLVFGSIHAYSALMAPLEQAFGTSRANVSLGYSLAIASLTCGVFASAFLLRVPASLLALVSGGAAAAGLGIGAAGNSLLLFLLGYGVIFGAANGVAYSLFLNRAAYAMPAAQGWSAGIVTACYGLGAAISALGFDLALAHASVQSILLGLAGVVAMASGIAAVLFRGGAGAVAVAARAAPARSYHKLVIWLWTVYFLGAAGGLMVIAHASGIVLAAGLGSVATGLAPSSVALGNIAGSLAGGPLGERWPSHRALAAPLLLLAGSMALLLILPEAGLAAVVLCGAAYGALIAVVPAVIRKITGSEKFAPVFGRVFTAWGLAGLSAPFAAGMLFDTFSGYGAAVGLAIAAAGAGALAALLWPPTSDR